MNIVAELQDDPELRGITYLNVEHNLCIQWWLRDTADKRKPDLVFFYTSNDKGSVRDFIIYDSIRKQRKAPCGSCFMVVGITWMRSGMFKCRIILVS